MRAATSVSWGMLVGWSSTLVSHLVCSMATSFSREPPAVTAGGVSARLLPLPFFSGDMNDDVSSTPPIRNCALSFNVLRHHCGRFLPCVHHSMKTYMVTGLLANDNLVPLIKFSQATLYNMSPAVPLAPVGAQIALTSRDQSVRSDCQVFLIVATSNPGGGGLPVLSNPEKVLKYSTSDVGIQFGSLTNSVAISVHNCAVRNW